jgi:hypothetical protein
MRGALTTLLVLVSLGLIFDGLVCLIRPSRKLGLKTRPRAFLAVAFGVLTFLGAAAVSPPQPASPPVPKAAVVQPVAAATPNPRPTFAGDGPGEAEIKATIAAYDKHPPRGAPELAGCDGARNPAWCEGAEYSFVHHDWPGAHRGDIEAAGNVAFCLADASNCGVEANPIQSCAWDLAIVISGSPDVSDTQTGHMRQHCGGLDEAGLAAAKIRAANLATSLPMFREPRD